MILLFDTDVLIDILRGKQETGIEVDKLTDNADELVCSVITVAELLAGMKKSEASATEGLLKDLIKMDVTEEIARIASHLKSIKSHKISLDDCLIAASALTINAQLVTKNGKHYPFKELNLRVIR